MPCNIQQRSTTFPLDGFVVRTEVCASTPAGTLSKDMLSLGGFFFSGGHQKMKFEKPFLTINFPAADFAVSGFNAQFARPAGFANREIRIKANQAVALYRHYKRFANREDEMRTNLWRLNYGG